MDTDVVVLATGTEKPDIGFLEKELFPEGYGVAFFLPCFGSVLHSSTVLCYLFLFFSDADVNLEKPNLLFAKLLC